MAHKYVARVPDTSGKSKWRYFYTTEEYQAFLKGAKNVANKVGQALAENGARSKQLADRKFAEQDAKYRNNVGYKMAENKKAAQAASARLKEVEQKLSISKEAEKRAKRTEAYNQATNTPEYRVYQYKKQQQEAAINAAKAKEAAIAKQRKASATINAKKQQEAALKSQAQKREWERRAAERDNERSAATQAARAKKKDRDEALKRIENPNYDRDMAKKRKEAATIKAKKAQEAAVKSQNAKKKQDPVERGKKAVNDFLNKAKSNAKNAVSNVEGTVKKTAEKAKKKVAVAKSKANQRKINRQNANSFTSRDDERVSDGLRYLNAHPEVKDVSLSKGWQDRLTNKVIGEGKKIDKAKKKKKKK